MSSHYIEYRYQDNNNTEFGWKLHISLDERQANVTKAWGKVIIPIVTEYKLVSFKCKRENQLNKQLDGKTITLYLIYNDELAGKSCCSESPIHAMVKAIHRGLQEQKITPGVHPDGDRQIVGSDYLFYRNEAGTVRGEIDGRPMALYLSAEAAKEVSKQRSTPEYNPYQYADSFNLSGLDLNPPQSRCIIL